MYVGTIIVLSLIITVCTIPNEDKFPSKTFQNAIESFEKKAYYPLTGFIHSLQKKLNNIAFVSNLSYEEIGNAFLTYGFKPESVKKAYQANLNYLTNYNGILAGGLALSLILLLLSWCCCCFISQNINAENKDSSCKLSLASFLAYANLHALALIWGIMIISYAEFSQNFPSRTTAFLDKFQTTVEVFETDVVFAFKDLILEEFDELTDSFISEMNHSTNSVVNEYFRNSKIKISELENAIYEKANKINTTMNILISMFTGIDVTNDTIFQLCENMVPTMNSLKEPCNAIQNFPYIFQSLENVQDQQLSEMPLKKEFNLIKTKLLKSINSEIAKKKDEINVFKNNISEYLDINLKKFNVSHYYSLALEAAKNNELIWNEFIEIVKYIMPLVCIIPAGVILILSVISMCCIVSTNPSNSGRKWFLRCNSFLGILCYVYYILVALSFFAVLFPTSKICHDLGDYDVIHDLIDEPYLISAKNFSLSNILRGCGDGETLFEVLNINMRNMQSVEKLLPEEADVMNILDKKDFGDNKKFHSKITNTKITLEQLKDYIDNVTEQIKENTNKINSMKNQLKQFRAYDKIDQLTNSTIVQFITSHNLKGNVTSLKNDTIIFINDLENTTDESFLIFKLELLVNDTERVLKANITNVVKESYNEAKKIPDKLINLIEGSTIAKCGWLPDIWEALLVQVCDYFIDGTICSYIQAGPLAIAILINFVLFIMLKNQ